MRIESRSEGGWFVVTPLDERIDASVAPDFKGSLFSWIQEGQTRILLDLTHVEFIDSSGLSVFISLLKALSGKGEVSLCSISETVMMLFKLTRMDRIFRIYSSVEAALQANPESPDTPVSS